MISPESVVSDTIILSMILPWLITWAMKPKGLYKLLTVDNTSISSSLLMSEHHQRKQFLGTKFLTSSPYHDDATLAVSKVEMDGVSLFRNTCTHMHPHAAFVKVFVKMVISVPKESQIVPTVLSDCEWLEHFLYVCVLNTNCIYKWIIIDITFIISTILLN